MHIASSELLIIPDKKALASQYHEALLTHLNRIPGFIEEKRYTSVSAPNKVLILSWWKDSAAIERWRNQSNHLRIQEKSSKDVFQDYRLRIGPTYNPDQDITDRVPPKRCFLVLHWRQKPNSQVLSDERTFELEDEAVSMLRASMLDDETYEDEASVLRLSGWASQEDMTLYEDSVVRVKGDHLERVRVERDYTKQRRNDAPHLMPGH